MKYRPTSLFVILIGSLLALTSLGWAQEKPNVLFIMTDDLNCDLGVYGHPQVKTPHIDRLARQGVLFKNAFCNFPQCGPSRASFMTGLYPEQNGVTVPRRLFRDYVPDVITLPQHFMNHGYTAARVGKIYHYDNPNGIGTDGHDDPASWNTRINPRGRDKDEEDKIFSLKPGSFGSSLSWLAADGKDEEQTDGMVATESIELLKQYSTNKTPFFLAVGFYKPHTPYVSPKKYFELYDESQIVIPKVPEGYLDTLPESARKTVTAHKKDLNLPEETARKAIRAYYAAISFVDAQIGRVLEAVDELGIRDNTIILFSSDHGYHLGEHGHYRKVTLFENADRVPLIISAPGMKGKGKQTEAFAEMIDFYRTLTDLAGLPPPPPYVKGVSQRPVLEGVSNQQRVNALTQLTNGYTLRTRQFRYTRWMDGAPENLELYNRLKDPEEMVNLAHDPNYAWVIETLNLELQKRIMEATSVPNDLVFTAPLPGDKGVKKTYE